MDEECMYRGRIESCRGAVWVEFAIVTILLMGALLAVNQMLGTIAVKAQDQTIAAQSKGVVCSHRTLSHLASLGIDAQEGCD